MMRHALQQIQQLKAINQLVMKQNLLHIHRTGIQGQNYTASNPRSFEGYVLYQQADSSTTSGELGNSVGTKYAELKELVLIITLNVFVK